MEQRREASRAGDAHRATKVLMVLNGHYGGDGREKVRKSVERYFARLGVLVELMPKFARKPDNIVIGTRLT